jgi:hypothetical protein
MNWHCPSEDDQPLPGQIAVGLTDFLLEFLKIVYPFR